MATANATRPIDDKLAWYLKHNEHSVWDTFPREQKEQMVADDLLAGVNVSMVLVSLITAGMVLSMVTVLAVLATL